MEVVTLPKDLKLKETVSVQFFDYQISRECLKQKIVLTQNTFSFLIEGTKEVITDRTSISIENSNFLIMKSGHCLMTEKLSSSNENYRSILLFFSNEVIFDFIRKYNISDEKSTIAESIHTFRYDDFLNVFVKSLMNINRLTLKSKEKIIQVKFEELMLYLVETKGPGFIHSLIANTDSQSQSFIGVVESNKLNRLTLKELAFLSNMSVSTFKREFEKHYKESPSKWFQDRRLEYSAFLLKNESRRPSDIFEEIGYENLSNFIHAFKTKFGVTPKQYQTD